jgi:hypothetical protein
VKTSCFEFKTGNGNIKRLEKVEKHMTVAFWNSIPMQSAHPIPHTCWTRRFTVVCNMADIFHHSSPVMSCFEQYLPNCSNRKGRGMNEDRPDDQRAGKGIWEKQTKLQKFKE